MPQGYAGLATRLATPSLPEPSVENSVLEDGQFRISPARPGGLHVVEVERHAENYFEPASCLAVAGLLHRRYPASKRLFDLIGATVAAVLMSPLILGIVAFAFASGGTPFYRHRRVGQNGQFFDCLKFRTMVENADQVLQKILDTDRQAKEEWLRHHKLRNDPRITGLGRFLRKTSLDELPQLWNVFRGEMSLVGPRPVVIEELRRYGRKVNQFLSARPGITGLWQISGRNDMDYRRRVALDVYYIRARSLPLDVYILLRTLPAVIKSSGAY